VVFRDRREEVAQIELEHPVRQHHDLDIADADHMTRHAGLRSVTGLTTLSAVTLQETPSGRQPVIPGSRLLSAPGRSNGPRCETALEGGARPYFECGERTAESANDADGPVSPAWAGVTEVGSAHQVGPQELRRRPARDQAAALEDMSVVGDRERLGDVLLDQEDGHVLVADAPDERHHLVDEPRRQTERRLVQHEQSRPPDQRTRERDHLLLAAAHRAGELAAALAQAGEKPPAPPPPPPAPPPPPV